MSLFYTNKYNMEGYNYGLAAEIKNLVKIVRCKFEMNVVR